MAEKKETAKAAEEQVVKSVEEAVKEATEAEWQRCFGLVCSSARSEGFTVAGGLSDYRCTSGLQRNIGDSRHSANASRRAAV